MQAVEKANEHCEKMGRVASIKNTSNRGVKWFPSSARIIFSCLYDNDPRNTMPDYAPPANIRIENYSR